MRARGRGLSGFCQPAGRVRSIRGSRLGIILLARRGYLDRAIFFWRGFSRCGGRV